MLLEKEVREKKEMDSPLRLIKLRVIIRSLNYEFTALTATIKRRESPVREKGGERKKKVAVFFGGGLFNPRSGVRLTFREIFHSVFLLSARLDAVMSPRHLSTLLACCHAARSLQKSTLGRTRCFVSPSPSFLVFPWESSFLEEEEEEEEIFNEK